MRDVFSEELYKYASKDRDIYIVSADISPAGKLIEFRKKNPDRFINVGVSEQAMIGIAAGLAIKKKRVFTYSIATFSLFRPFEMIRVDLCYQNLPVVVVGMGAGTVYASLGATHLSQEDISIARSLPNFNIIAPCDPLELKEVIKYLVTENKSPTYLRIGKAGEMNFTNNSIESWNFGKIRKIFDGNTICIITYGPIIALSIEVKNFLESSGLTVSIYSAHTIKPFDFHRLKKIFNKYKKIIVIEDHSEIGGLASIVQSYLYKSNYKGLFYSFSLKDKFFHEYSSQKSLLKFHGIDLKSIIKKILKK